MYICLITFSANTRSVANSKADNIANGFITKVTLWKTHVVKLKFILERALGGRAYSIQKLLKNLEPLQQRNGILLGLLHNI